MSHLEELARRAEHDFDLVEFSRLVQVCRSYRRFDEEDPIPEALLVELVDLARITSSGANRLPLRFRLVSSAKERADVFAQISWAGALPDWDGPEVGERPSGYIVICDAGGGATTAVDEGIAAQTIVLAATKAGFGACMLHAFSHDKVAAVLGLDGAGVKPLMIVALGRPVESVRLEPLAASPDGSTNYWRDAAGVHHVPKRSLDAVVV